MSWESVPKAPELAARSLFPDHNTESSWLLPGEASTLHIPTGLRSSKERASPPPQVANGAKKTGEKWKRALGGPAMYEFHKVEAATPFGWSTD